MERHEYFEALCAAASIGQASGAELAELQEHLGGCSGCQQAYGDFLQLGAVRAVADANNHQEINAPEAIGYIDSALFREKFLKKAEAEGILSLRERPPIAMPDPVSRPIRHRSYTTFAVGLAASILLALGVVGVYRGKLNSNPSSSETRKDADIPLPLPAVTTPTDPKRDASILRRPTRCKICEGAAGSRSRAQAAK